MSLAQNHSCLMLSLKYTYPVAMSVMTGVTFVVLLSFLGVFLQNDISSPGVFHAGTVSLWPVQGGQLNAAAASWVYYPDRTMMPM